MITVDQIPWPTWCAIGALGVTLGALLGSIIAERRMVRVAAVAFILLALCSFTASTFAEAPRPAAVIPAPSVGMREGRPDQQRTGAPTLGADLSAVQVVAPSARARDPFNGPGSPRHGSARKSAETAGVGTPSSPTNGKRAASVEAQPAAKPPAATDAMRGVASWFRAPSGTAAAGPALRRALGSDWRGSRVSVCGSEGCATVRLTDWMRADKLVDLNPSAFRAVCGPLSKGVCRVTVRRAIVPPATDTAP